MKAPLPSSVTRALRGRARGSARIFLRGPTPSPSVLRVRNGQNGALIVVFEEARVLSFDGLNEKSLFSVIARIKRPLLGYEKCPILHIWSRQRIGRLQTRASRLRRCNPRGRNHE